jgi:ADP-heptose:LPS heptosyltransferase
MACWKNYFIVGLVYFLRWFEGRGKSHHFLIVSTTGLGDTLWATPAIRALREAYPRAYIGCLTAPLGAEVLKGNPYLDELFVFHGTTSLLKLYFQLKRRQIGTLLLFHTSQRALLPLCSVIGASKRIGTAGLQKGLDSLLTHPLQWKSSGASQKNLGVESIEEGGSIHSIQPPSSIAQPREFSRSSNSNELLGSTTSHEIERRLDIVKAAGASPATYGLDFFIEENDRKAAKELIPPGIVIGLHPGSKDRFKQWPADYFVQLGQQLQRALDCTIIVSGSRVEKELVEQICHGIGKAQPLIEPLRVMAAVLENLTLFITNDTGPLHVALAMKTPTIALFAPTNSAICGPHHNLSTQVIQAAPTCKPCLKKKCRDPFCMRQISPHAVVQAALKKLKEPL